MGSWVEAAPAGYLSLPRYFGLRGYLQGALGLAGGPGARQLPQLASGRWARTALTVLERAILEFALFQEGSRWAERTGGGMAGQGSRGRAWPLRDLSGPGPGAQTQWTVTSWTCVLVFRASFVQRRPPEPGPPASPQQTRFCEEVRSTVT